MIQQLAQQNSGFDMSMFQPLPPPPPPLSPTSPESFRTPGQDGASGANVDEAGGSGGAHDPNVGDHGRRHVAAASSSSSSPHCRMVDAGADACGRVLEWETGLPTAGEMTPISHQLVPPALAAAFRIDLSGVVLPSSSVDSPTSHLSFRVDDADGDDEGEWEGLGRRGAGGER
ncbi:hypothetical protein GUJ93_ZPchr0007g3832 [Zizania palustris]|uniref:Uncharacterized protein n=1 Tax=Zizania palustris TaxID=103762 RepID=A0A8J5T1J2_ZIZPA|nr:hypothetical protein GUJ93_ZPchr0007g3832 [Zizania palustris]